MFNEYSEFKSEDSAYKWINNNYKKFIDGIQKDSFSLGTLGHALFCYTGSMSEDYNNILRLNNGNITNIDNVIDKYYLYNNDDNISPISAALAIDAKKDIRLIHNAFFLNVIKDNIKLFHYFNMNYYGKEILKEKEFVLNSFVSTTMIKDSIGISKLISRKNYDSLLLIKVKRGTNCIPIWNHPNSCLKEYEIILKPQTHFKINKVRRKWFGKVKYLIECELI